MSCSTGVISSTLVSIGSDLSNHPLSTLNKSLITSSTSLLALLSSPFSGLLADSLGRKPLILLADALFILGALWQSLSTTIWSMILGRAIIGIAVGSASFVVPLYISELAPAKWRGRLVTISTLMITAGQVVAYIVGWGFSSVHGGWKWMVGLGAVPAALQLCILLFMPETPRWLVRDGKVERARKVLGRVYGGVGGGDVVEGILRIVGQSIKEEEAARKVGDFEGEGWWASQWRGLRYTFRELVGVGGNRRALSVACMLQGSQQLCGFNSLMYFSATIFAMVGFANPTATSLVIASTNFLFTLATFHYIDRIGRRRILLLSIPVMVFGLALCAIAFKFVHLPQNHGSPPLLGRLLRESGPWPTLIVLSMIIYVASYALGLGCVPWQQSELFPLSVRSLGSSIATATNWGSNTIVGLTFLPLMEAITPTGTFALYAGVCAAAWCAVWLIYPETAGLGLEEVEEVLKDGWGVEESLRVFRERKRVGMVGRRGNCNNDGG
ncbi:general substrate transporter [Tothia fuscella]|uniref:General substrate transporter n=1 Tax=Tothia fuscella TaxID=1048955 RepID=A0A9P4NKF4_9PEZI|nr:general substrate transporter [Tothia fuscella]